MASSKWLTQLLRWLRRILGQGEAHQQAEVTEKYHADHVTVFRLKNPAIPGCCDFWKLERHRERATFWICCINSADMRVDLTALGISQSDFLRTNHRGLAANLSQQLTEQAQFRHTHYWVTGFSIPYQGTDPKGRHYNSSRLVDVQLLAGDFQGVRGQLAGDRYIQYYARQCVDRLANDTFREFSQHQTWRAAVKAIDWAGWLEGQAQRSKLRIGTDHKLQVRKSHART